MTDIKVEQGEAPQPDAYVAGLENGRKVRHKYTTETIAAFKKSVQYKHDKYTKGFIEGLTENKAG